MKGKVIVIKQRGCEQAPPDVAMHIKEQEASSLIQEALANMACTKEEGGGSWRKRPFVTNKLEVTLITGKG